MNRIPLRQAEKPRTYTNEYGTDTIASIRLLPVLVSI